MAGLFTGCVATTARRATASVAPGHGEVDAVPAPEPDRDGARADDERASSRTSWKCCRSCRAAGHGRLPRGAAAAPRTASSGHVRQDRHDAIRPQDRNDLALVGITPVVRHPHTPLGGGRYAIAFGDVHVTMDPLLGQGANVGSYSAFALADAIVEADAFDLAFCRAVERGRAARVLAASRWTNAFLQPPDAARIELMAAISQDRQLAGPILRELQPARVAVEAGRFRRTDTQLAARTAVRRGTAFSARSRAKRWLNRYRNNRHSRRPTQCRLET